MTHTFINKVREKLQNDLPGVEAQYKMTHAVRRTYAPAPPDARTAAVMCLFYEKNDEPYLVFIRRTSSNPNDNHGGQIAFPGGKSEEEDADYASTALRETEEEIGLPTADIEVLGALTPLYIPVSNFQVYPFVGYLRHVPKFIPQETEVEEILEIPYSLFLDKGIRKLKDIRVRDNMTLKDVPYFALGDRVLWGATAMMMSELLEVLEEAEAES